MTQKNLSKLTFFICYRSWLRLTEKAALQLLIL